MISRELHDTVAQDLSAAKIGCDNLSEENPNLSPLLKEKIAGISKALQYSIQSVRELSYGLRPPNLDNMGLEETISGFCRDFTEETGIELEYSSFGMDHLELDPDMQINLYRLVQEGLNNVRKHANAGQATVGLIGSSKNIILTVEDNGRGFDVEKRMVVMDEEKKLGLRSMEERARLLGGRFQVQSSPGKGTCVIITIPFGEKTDG
jgi:signal transduction histidine kinase